MKYFWLTTRLVILETKISLVSIKKFLYQCHPPYTYLYFIGSYNNCTCNRGLLESYYCYVLFLSFNKIFQILRIFFLIPSLYFLEKKFLVNKYKNRKINLYLFDIMKNCQIFSSKICHFQCENRFLLSREIGNLRTCREVRLQKLTQFKLPL